MCIMTTRLSLQAKAVNTLLGLSIVAAAPAAWFYLRSKGSASQPELRSKKQKPAAMPGKRRNFKAASIHPGEVCCQEVTRRANERFLLDEVPRLPLEACDKVNECSCTYRNHADRRSGEDRRELFGSLSKSGGLNARDDNQRSGMDRRSSVDTDFDDIEFDA